MGFYTAPVQAMANGGVLVIDDFGRQRCSPRDLLNRWIVPLESRVDFLTLQTGQKFELPFMVAGRVRHQHQAGGSGGRGVPAPHPLQGVCREPDADDFDADLRELLPNARPSLRPGAGRSPAREATSSRVASRCAAAIRAT